MAKIMGKGFSYDDVLILPKYNKILSRKDVDLKTKVSRNIRLAIPLIAANMDTICEAEMAIAIGKLGGLGIIHRYLSIDSQVKEIKKIKSENLIAAAAIGIKDYLERVPKLIESGLELLVLDIAHGHSKYAGKTLDWIKKNYPQVDVMVGNIATKDAAHYFFSKGADAIKVGVGPGAMCTTRIMSGAGVPQITAIMEAYEETQGRIPLCADGGIRNPGDLTKAIGAGADTVMVGSIFSGTEETPGEIIEKDGCQFKKYRGMASYDATIRRLSIDGKTDEEIISVEGESTLVKYQGPVQEIIKKFLGGLASGMTYTGCCSIEDLRGKADFIEISSAGMNESIAHGVKK
ncbi:guanosine monophosphate reductase [Candidatus Pacearchaeota archaeon]|nr:guanosine monophosphate reductase [Candidatus Pacearchaeota archaeon]